MARRTQPRAVPRKIEIRKNDIVKVIAGRDRGKTGRVLSVDRQRGRVLVEGVMLVKRHTRANPARQIKGGIAERESPIAISNVMIVCTSCNRPVRIGHKVEMVAGKARRTRICRKCGAPLEPKR
ncbi:MAG: 50S ribosomal protein L24 [Bryobacterales bacterium]|nr:50S ribosomal protein L24 [Bryobacteraceae bacterium]MDW8354794.1 50S ribosomal protein L24 [Bryobacterales bacterium]